MEWNTSAAHRCIFSSRRIFPFSPCWLRRESPCLILYAPVAPRNAGWPGLWKGPVADARSGRSLPSPTGPFSKLHNDDWFFASLELKVTVSSVCEGETRCFSFKYGNVANVLRAGVSALVTEIRRPFSLAISAPSAVDSSICVLNDLMYLIITAKRVKTLPQTRKNYV